MKNKRHAVGEVLFLVAFLGGVTWITLLIALAFYTISPIVFLTLGASSAAAALLGAMCME